MIYESARTNAGKYQLALACPRGHAYYSEAVIQVGALILRQLPVGGRRQRRESAPASPGTNGAKRQATQTNILTP